MNLKLLAAAAVAAGLVAGVASQANAAVILSDSPNGSSWTTVASSGTTNSPDSASVGGSFSVGPFTATGYFYNDNVPGTPSSAFGTVTTFALTNNGSSSATEYFFVGAGDYSAPATGPYNLLTHWTANDGGAGVFGSFSEFGCVFTNPGALANSCAGGASVTATTTGSSLDNSSGSSVMSSVATPFELGAVIAVTLGAGATYQVSVTDTLTPVPEPISIAIFGFGLAGLGLVRLRRSIRG
jgi:hypothetical protein